MSIMKFSLSVSLMSFLILSSPVAERKTYSEETSLLSAINVGVEKAYRECRYQFETSRFNCPRSYHSDIVLKRNLNRYKLTKEDALMRATLNAGVVHSLIKSCNKGMNTECGCKRGKNFDWDGCQKTLAWAMETASSFLDSKEGKDQESLVRIHNNQVGRFFVKLTIDNYCRCHGTSGSCALKSCWLQLGSFRSIGRALSKRYEKAVKLERSDKNGLNFSPPEVIVKDRILLYLDDSPNYCRPDLEIGTIGTLGRSCTNSNDTQNQTQGNAMGTCEHLCHECGYGNALSKRTSHEKCKCRFKWCCELQCEPCSDEMVHVCVDKQAPSIAPKIMP